MFRTGCISAVIAGIALSALAVVPASAATFSYLLADHPDRAIKARDYGIRLDSLSPDHFFSFDTNDTKLHVDTVASSAFINGTVRENGSGTDTWFLAYNLSSALTVDDPAKGTFTADGGFGTLTNLNTLEVINLVGKSNGTAEFLFLDDGHRLPTSDGLVGRGWLQGMPSPNDFLFTATTVVPLPAGIALLASALGAFGLVGWRRKKAIGV
ncbi:VPLPA-CTERM sorting domain-containing protein [Roseibium sp. HPY-6]|uniref:VPLPA-CTERM sorting domain-containing protein n=1 Tax=Roseibium sp. HPY-6 TaxID=3229852 RepID=UPI00338F3684